MLNQLSIVFVGLLLTANVIGGKPLQLAGLIIPAGLTIFPLTYLLADTITEIYGFKKSRQVIWMGMLCNIFLAIMCNLAVSLPAIPSWQHSDAYATVLGINARLTFISVTTYFVGEIINAGLVSRLKIYFKGKFFFARALCGNWIGEGIETSLFVPIAFYGTMPNEELFKMWLFYYSFKVCYALVAMPFTSALVTWLKKNHITEIQ